MLVGNTEIVCKTGELLPNVPDSGVRPYVVVTKNRGNHLIYQDRNGKFVQTDDHGNLLDHVWSIELNEKEETAVRRMFTQFNSNVAPSLRGRRALGKLWRRFPGDTISVGLVACGAKKRDLPSKAKDLYLGELFKKSRRWCEVFMDDWGILSAKHGLVLPDKTIEPYDQRLPTKDDEIRLWSSKVSFDVYFKWGEDTHFYLLAGAGYRLPFEDHNRRHHVATAPMKGLSIGQQLSWLKTQVEGAPQAKQETGQPKRRRLKLGAPRKAKT